LIGAQDLGDVLDVLSDIGMCGAQAAVRLGREGVPAARDSVSVFTPGDLLTAHSE
jgi:hypothetical protein